MKPNTNRPNILLNTQKGPRKIKIPSHNLPTTTRASKTNGKKNPLHLFNSNSTTQREKKIVIPSTLIKNN